MKTLKALLILKLFDIVYWIKSNYLVILLYLLGIVYSVLLIMWLKLQFYGNIR